jgi:hypothetical protein
MKKLSDLQANYRTVFFDCDNDYIMEELRLKLVAENWVDEDWGDNTILDLSEFTANDVSLMLMALSRLFKHIKYQKVSKSYYIGRQIANFTRPHLRLKTLIDMFSPFEDIETYNDISTGDGLCVIRSIYEYFAVTRILIGCRHEECIPYLHLIQESECPLMTIILNRLKNRLKRSDKGKSTKSARNVF